MAGSGLASLGSFIQWPASGQSPGAKKHWKYMKTYAKPVLLSNSIANSREQHKNTMSVIWPANGQLMAIQWLANGQSPESKKSKKTFGNLRKTNTSAKFNCKYKGAKQEHGECLMANQWQSIDLSMANLTANQINPIRFHLIKITPSIAWPFAGH